jgi:hypothetical protein
VVRNLSLKYFRGCLVEHFDILFHRHQVQWPARRADRAPTIAEVWLFCWVRLLPSGGYQSIVLLFVFLLIHG